MKRMPLHPRRTSEQGGVTILTVLALLVLATVMAFALGRNSLREIVLSGTATQAEKATEASEAGLDWFVLWANKANWSIATDYKRNTFVNEFQTLVSSSWEGRTYPLSAASKSTDRASRITSSETDTNTDMVFTNSGTDYVQSSATTGNQAIQSFDLLFRCLGPNALTQTTSSVSAVGSNLYLVQVQSTGKSSTPSATGGYTQFNAVREMMVNALP
ncbi:MAG TPA: hypothetical protein VN436_08430 [Holophaga sp.]|nr:hypothetical protein [Holophaga sp.]